MTARRRAVTNTVPGNRQQSRVKDKSGRENIDGSAVCEGGNSIMGLILAKFPIPIKSEYHILLGRGGKKYVELL